MRSEEVQAVEDVIYALHPDLSTIWSSDSDLKGYTYANLIIFLCRKAISDIPFCKYVDGRLHKFLHLTPVSLGLVDLGDTEGLIGSPTGRSQPKLRTASWKSAFVLLRLGKHRLSTWHSAFCESGKLGQYAA